MSGTHANGVNPNLFGELNFSKLENLGALWWKGRYKLIKSYLDAKSLLSIVKLEAWFETLPSLLKL